MMVLHKVPESEIEEAARVLLKSIEKHWLYIPTNTVGDLFGNYSWLPTSAMDLDERAAKKGLELLLNLCYIEKSPTRRPLPFVSAYIVDGHIYSITALGEFAIGCMQERNNTA